MKASFFVNLLSSFLRKHALCTTVLLALPAAWAQTTTLHTFANDTLSANLVQAADGTIYGVTRPSSGTSTGGYVFKLQPDGSGYQTVYTFASGSGSARLPDYSFIQGRDGVLYGTSEFGGAVNFGMLYKLNANGSGFSLLRSFTAGGATVVNDGGAPRGGLVHATDGFLYGVTTTGTGTGTSLEDRNGVVYRVAPDGSGYTMIFSFNVGIFSANGGAPNSLIQGRDGKLYGTARGGPLAGGGTGGVVFTLRTDGTGFTVLKAFGNLSTPTVIHDPQSPLVHASDGYLYGATRFGGPNGDGVLYRLQTDGSGFQVIYAFSDNTPANAANGIEPTGALIQGSDGSIYGRTNNGGSSNNGVIFKIRPDGTGFRVVYNFAASRSAYFGGLIQGLDGALYATTASTIVRIVEASGPTITTQPSSATAALGGSVTLNVAATGATSYQWRKNGAAIAGATNASLTLSSLSLASSGNYDVVTTNADGSTVSATAILLINDGQPNRLSNLSVRTTLAANQILTVGFNVRGGSKPVLIRAAGPTLGAPPFNIPGTMADPKLAIFNTATPPVKIDENDNWGGNTAIFSTGAALGAFPFTNSASLDAAVVHNVDGGRTVQVSGPTAGNLIVEAYDTNLSASPKLVNLSARNFVGTGNDILTAGFNIAGTSPKNILIRAVGPSLAAPPFNIPGTMADPKLVLFNTANPPQKIDENDNYLSTLTGVFNSVGAFGLVPGAKDAVLMVQLPPGGYTVQISGADGGTGDAIVEVYELP